ARQGLRLTDRVTSVDELAARPAAGAGVRESGVTTIGIHQQAAQPAIQPARSTGIVRRVLVWGGVLSLPLYVATDAIGGMRYEGYNFSSRAISELMAVGAPSKALVDPFFLLYSLLALAFGIGVLRVAGNRNRPL